MRTLDEARRQVEVGVGWGCLDLLFRRWQGPGSDQRKGRLGQSVGKITGGEEGKVMRGQGRMATHVGH